jgi:hypothetical protein
VVADEDAGKSLPEAAITRIRGEFTTKYAAKASNAPEHAFDK